MILPTSGPRIDPDAGSATCGEPAAGRRRRTGRCRRRRSWRGRWPGRCARSWTCSPSPRKGRRRSPGRFGRQGAGDRYAATPGRLAHRQSADQRDQQAGRAQGDEGHAPAVAVGHAADRAGRDDRARMRIAVRCMRDRRGAPAWPGNSPAITLCDGGRHPASPMPTLEPRQQQRREGGRQCRSSAVVTLQSAVQIASTPTRLNRSERRRRRGSPASALQSANAGAAEQAQARRSLRMELRLELLLQPAPTRPRSRQVEAVDDHQDAQHIGAVGFRAVPPENSRQARPGLRLANNDIGHVAPRRSTPGDTRRRPDCRIGRSRAR